MNYTDADISILAHMIKNNDISVEEVIEWAYSQYTDNGVEPWIEKVTLALDKSDLLDVLRDNFRISEELEPEVRAGKIAHDYFQEKLSLMDALRALLYDVFIDSEINEEKKQLYIAEDYFEWHESPNTEALKMAQPILEKYLDKYELSHRKFGA